MNDRTLCILKEARKLLGEKGEAWTQGEYVREAANGAGFKSSAVLTDPPEFGEDENEEDWRYLLFTDDGLQYCAVGAIDVAARIKCDKADKKRAFSALMRSLPSMWQRAIWKEDPSVAIIDWNDMDHRTATEVIEAYDRAIALVETEDGEKAGKE